MGKCKVCCIILVVIFVLILGATSFMLLYMPKADRMAKQLATDTIEVQHYEAGAEVYSTKVNEILDFINNSLDVEYELKDVIEFYSKEEGDDAAYGCVLYVDSIGSAFKLAYKYVRFISDKTSEEVSLLDKHISPRGNAIFVGNATAEIEFRKVVF